MEEHRALASVECPTRMIASSLIDIGINLGHDSFNSDRDAVIARAAQAGVVQMIVTGSTGSSTRQAIALAQGHCGRLFATAGVSPPYSRGLSGEILAELRQLPNLPGTGGAGACGVDHYPHPPP